MTTDGGLCAHSTHDLWYDVILIHLFRHVLFIVFQPNELCTTAEYPDFKF